MARNSNGSQPNMKDTGQPVVSDLAQTEKIFNGELNRRNVSQSIVLLILFTIVIIGLMLLMILMDQGGATRQYFKDNLIGLITTIVAMFLLSIICYVYFVFEDRSMITSKSSLLELYLLFAICFVLDFVLGRYLSIWARPMVLFALIIGMFKKNKDAIFLNTIYAVLLFVFSRFLYNNDMSAYGMTQIESFANFLCVFCGGMISIFIIKKMKTRVTSLLVAFIMLVPILVINLVMDLPSGDVATATGVIDVIIFSALGCIISVLLFMFFEPIFEVLFKELTSFRLRELTSENAPLIKRLRDQAPGTFNHSVVVAQLAAACARVVHEDPELTRAAAYYHDMGKLFNPMMFSENQKGQNLHDQYQYDPEVSADIIRSHTTKGAEFIHKNHLPDLFVDVAIQHHGTMPIMYFYARALRLSSGQVNIQDFSYKGPKPQTKIAAIIMISDACEAASRSLKDRSEENVEALVTKLIQERLTLEQFMECDLTMHDLTEIQKAIVIELTGVYHKRVAYPPKFNYSTSKEQ
ncbi:MAG: HDIG domain-containing protein [Clostridia bacterium]|nr:HDIG domain-containing protein [Clostridia bacterium]